MCFPYDMFFTRDISHLKFPCDMFFTNEISHVNLWNFTCIFHIWHFFCASNFKCEIKHVEFHIWHSNNLWNSTCEKFHMCKFTCDSLHVDLFEISYVKSHMYVYLHKNKVRCKISHGKSLAGRITRETWNVKMQIIRTFTGYLLTYLCDFSHRKNNYY